MAQSVPIDPNILSDLYQAFSVSKGNYDLYNKVYNEDILPRIQKKYLAHLVASIEDIIDEKLKKDKKLKNPEDTSNDNIRDFLIVLHPGDVPQTGDNAVLECQPKRAVIKYKQSPDYKEMRIFIAHELGHILQNYKIILGDNSDNHADLFAFLAINGKNNFYQTQVKELLYNDEKEIIESIKRARPINGFRQKNKNPPDKNEENI